MSLEFFLNTLKHICKRTFTMTHSYQRTDNAVLNLLNLLKAFEEVFLNYADLVFLPSQVVLLFVEFDQSYDQNKNENSQQTRHEIGKSQKEGVLSLS